jgi:hypothetical protein
MKLKVGDKVNFEFLGIPEVGIIEQIRPLSLQCQTKKIDTLSMMVNTSYPIATRTNIQGKL